MDEKKQIEEMARIIADNTEFDTMWDEIYASADALYNAGYRKQSENTVELPCKVGDTVYCIWQYNLFPDFAKTEPPFITESKVFGFVIDKGIVKIIPEHYAEMADSWHRLLDVAFTKEEAEAKMKGGAE